ncbi:hypothetical protein I79_018786 [Cricetulus griseus]|uniref:Uncharacterized protein n=1 Tax=Cricetulus griseus TaxID=10029 RepID=G3I5N3_CRIGR|nr:hypothetical protein I79_018786 [Cricetulus griseus]
MQETASLLLSVQPLGVGVLGSYPWEEGILAFGSCLCPPRSRGRVKLGPLGWVG